MKILFSLVYSMLNVGLVDASPSRVKLLELLARAVPEYTEDDTRLGDCTLASYQAEGKYVLSISSEYNNGVSNLDIPITNTSKISEQQTQKISHYLLSTREKSDVWFPSVAVPIPLIKLGGSQKLWLSFDDDKLVGARVFSKVITLYGKLVYKEDYACGKMYSVYNDKFGGPAKTPEPVKLREILDRTFTHPVPLPLPFRVSYHAVITSPDETCRLEIYSSDYGSRVYMLKLEKQNYRQRSIINTNSREMMEVADDGRSAIIYDVTRSEGRQKTPSAKLSFSPDGFLESFLVEDNRSILTSEKLPGYQCDFDGVKFPVMLAKKQIATNETTTESSEDI